MLVVTCGILRNSRSFVLIVLSLNCFRFSSKEGNARLDCIASIGDSTFYDFVFITLISGFGI